ncbi:DUF4982 domain-containing protein [Pseudoduganella sp. R-34]|uniref:DUF4982 domain-containing protein n=1 Tax=Pseudoduganella sp. R-34 TaxID=3404062 RepID=UPI003CFB53B2
MKRLTKCRALASLLLWAVALLAAAAPRERLSINAGWRFTMSDPAGTSASLRYDGRPEVKASEDGKAADAVPQAAALAAAAQEQVLKPWILPSGNAFISDPARRHRRPAQEPQLDVAYLKPGYDDGAWKRVDLPHDWAIAGPFLETGPYGGVGRLPSWGIGWYRKALDIPASDRGRSIFLDVDGAMSYAMVWLNGKLVGGWPYGYNSWRLDLTPYVVPGGSNMLAIRLDNPPESSRWYPGGGIYRNVWLTKTAPIHVAHWGTHVRTARVSRDFAEVSLEVAVDNDSRSGATVSVATAIYALDEQGTRSGQPVAHIQPQRLQVAAGASNVATGSTTIARPRLWGPPPTQHPHRYVAVTTVRRDGVGIDEFETRFGIRDVRMDPDKGMLVNGERIALKGVNNHHDLGALGAAFNVRAAERQLQMLVEMGANALRMSHNPPAPELLELTDRMGIVVIDEVFDVWERKKTALDTHLIFPDWHDMTAMNYARAHMPLPATVDLVSVNYQGAGIRSNPGRFPEFRARFPGKMIFSSESASALSSRGEYQFPVTGALTSSVRPDAGGDWNTHQVSAYELYASDFGTSADRSWSAQDQYPYVAGEFVWSGWDYLGEPTPFYSSRSSYSGIIDLAGFKKDRFYLYQARWRPDLPLAHILPHWTWPGREGKFTPVHVFTSGAEAELFVNGKSQGRKKRAEFEYRLRWDLVTYEPGELKVIAYKEGKEWAASTVRTVGPAAKLDLVPDRSEIAADGADLSFITLHVTDQEGNTVPMAKDSVKFSIEGPGEIVATDNGDPTSFVPFPSTERPAFNGLCLAIVRGKPGQKGAITVRAQAPALQGANVTLQAH